MVNSPILELNREYTRRKHLEYIPQEKIGLPQELSFIYDPEWEANNDKAPYEILTQLMDCYYCLPERPDLATLFCWQAINHSYNEFLLQDSDKKKLKDSTGIDKLIEKILADYKVYEPYLMPFIKALPDKAYNYVASYILKGCAIEKAGYPLKYVASSYSGFKSNFLNLHDIVARTFGDILYGDGSKVRIENNQVKTHADKEKNRKLTYTLGRKLRELVEAKEASFELEDKSFIDISFTDKESIDFIIRYILYASRCNNFHGNVASRLNSDNAKAHTFQMYTNIFLLEYMILGISLHSQGYLSDDCLDKLKANKSLLL